MWGPSPKKIEYRIGMMDGGLNTKLNPGDLDVRQSPDLQNVQFSTVGAVETSRGYIALNASPLSSGPVDGLAAFAASGVAQHLVAVASGVAYRMVSTAGSAISGASVFTAGRDASLVQYQSHLWMSDGVCQGYKYNGSEATQAGVRTVATGAVSFASTAASGPATAGVYSYGMTAVNSAGAEGGYVNLGTYTLAVASHAIDVSGLPVYPASAGVVSRNVYRSAAGGFTQYYQGAIANNTATTYTDTTSVYVTAVDYTLGPMPAHKFLVEHYGYLFAAGDSSYPTRLYYSEQGEPEHWPPANYLEVGQDDGLNITGLRVFSGVLVITKNDGSGNGCIYVLTLPSDSPADWVLTRTNVQTGAQSGKSVVGFNDRLTFVSGAGVYGFSAGGLATEGQYSALGTFGVENLAWPISPDLAAGTKGNYDQCAAIDHNNRMYVSFPIDALYNNTIYIYDHSTITAQGKAGGVWSKLTGPRANNFAQMGGELYAGDAVTGSIYRLETTAYNYNGGAIDSYYTTPYLYGLPEHRQNTKVFRFALLSVELVGDWDLYIGYRVDPGASFQEVTQSLKPATWLWGTSLWGTGVWGSPSRYTFRLGLPGMVGQMVQFRFRTNAADKYFKVYDLRLLYNLRGQR